MTQSPSHPITNPYVGPRTFTEQEGRFFFGREREARDLTALIVSERLLLFYAQSGAGKSSLLNARVIPRLRDEEHFQVLPVGRVSGELPAGVAQVDNIYAFNLMTGLDQSGEHPQRLAQVTLSDFLARLARATVVDAAGERSTRWVYKPEIDVARPAEGVAQPAASGPRFALVIDQFEEIVTNHPGRWREREGFFRQLNQALLDDPTLWVVLSLREDYVASLDPYAELLFNRLRARFYMERMGVAAALDAVRRPAELASRPFAPGAAEQLVDNLCQVRVAGQEATVPGQYVEPVQLQVVCFQMWENLGRGTEGTQITLEDLAVAGDIDRALTQFYEETMALALADSAAAGVNERQVRAWFDEELITEAGTRGLVHQGEQETGSLPNGVVRALQRRFLVRGEARGGDTWIELVHDRFVEPIRQANRTWFSRNLNPLTLDAQTWLDAGKPASKLYTGSQLAAAADQIQANPAEFGDTERAFIEAGQQVETQRADRRQRDIALGGAVLALVLVVVLGSLAIKARRESLKAKANELAATVALQINQPVFDPSLALLLALEGVNRTKCMNHVEPNADGSLQNAVATAQRINWQKTLSLDDQISHTDRVRSAAYSPDGRFIVSAGCDGSGGQVCANGSAHIWDASTGEEHRTLVGHTDEVWSAAYSPDGQFIVTASLDGTVRLWDANTGMELNTLLGGRVVSAAFSPDGQRIVTAGEDESVRIWETATGKEVGSLEGHSGPLYDAAYSPDGARIVSAGRDGTVRIWDASTGKQLQSIPAHAGRARSAVYSPDGKHVVTAGCDSLGEEGCGAGSVRIWDAETGKEQRTLFGLTGEVLSATYSPDGKLVVAAGADGIARVRDATTGKDLRALLGHTDSVLSAVYSPDGQHIVTASADGTARTWGADNGDAPRRLDGHDDWVWAAAYSPDGRHIVTASADQIARIWDTSTGEQLHALGGHKLGIGSAAYSPDGQFVVTASVDGTARLWDTSTGEELHTLAGHEGGVNSAAYSPNGQLLVTASRDGTARIWDANTGMELRTLLGHDGSVISAAFSPDGQRIVTAGEDKSVRIWDAATGKEVAKLEGHSDAVGDATYSPDGRRIVSAGRDGTVRIWDASNGKQLQSVLAHAGRARSAAYSPDGDYVVTAGCDRLGDDRGCLRGSVRIWDAETGKEERTLFGLAREVLSAAYSPDGKLVVAAGAEGIARIWDATIEQLMAEAERLIQRDPPELNPEERNVYGLE